MATYYFTFGQSHCQIDGTPMKDYWVRIDAEDFGSARQKFVEQFSSQFMEREDKLAFQYDDEDFKPDYFSKGEYAFYA